MTKSSAFDFEVAYRERVARIVNETPRLVEQYGELTDHAVADILNVEDEIVACEGCRGNCSKSFNRWRMPVIHVKNPHIDIALAPCPFGVDMYIVSKCDDAGIPERYGACSRDDYKVTDVNQRAVKIADAMISGQFKRGAFFYGSTGSGKTFLASIIAKEFIRQGKRVVFRDMPTLLTDIKSTFDGKSSTRNFLNDICRCDLLVLDDAGAEKVTEWSVEQLYLIVNRRYNLDKRLIVTANFDMSAFERRLGGDMVARRITSRLKEMCAQAFFGTVDARD